MMNKPATLTGLPTVYLSGNAANATAVVRALLMDIGWEDTQILDPGGIEAARGPEAVMLLATDGMKATGFEPSAISPVRCTTGRG